MDKREQISRKLEPTDWRTTQREQRVGYEHKRSVEVWGLMLRYIIRFQNENAGRSPSLVEIAAATEVGRSAVRYHLNMMEERSLIRRGPLGIEVLSGAKVATRMEEAEPQGPVEKTEEASVVSNKDPKLESATFVERSRAIATVINGYRAKFGISPQVKEIAEVVGYKSPGAASSVIKRMTQLGWLDHKKGHKNDLSLTSLGQSVLFGDGMTKPEEAQVIPEEARTIRSAQPMPTIALRQALRFPPPPSPQEWFGGANADPAFVVPPMPDLSLADYQPGEVVRWDGPEKVELVPQGPPNLKAADTVDLMMELQERGFIVKRPPTTPA